MPKTKPPLEPVCRVPICGCPLTPFESAFCPPCRCALWMGMTIAYASAAVVSLVLWVVWR